MKYALYDMSMCPASYDFLTFCIVAKAQCKAMNEKCHVIFKQDFSKPNRKPYPVKEKMFRMSHVLFPICTAMGLSYSTEGSMEVFPNIEESQMLRSKDCPYQLLQILNQYKETPLEWPQPSERAKEMVRKEFPEPPVVITLRETYTEGRNSNLNEWLAFGDYVYESNEIVFVRDTSKWNELLPDEEFSLLSTFPIASIDLDIRLALYQHAKINFSVGGGPTILLHCSQEIPYRTFKMLYEGYKSSASEFLTKMGFPSGSQFPWHTKDQKVIWEDDTFENLKHEYDQWIGEPTPKVQKVYEPISKSRIKVIGEQ